MTTAPQWARSGGAQPAAELHADRSPAPPEAAIDVRDASVRVGGRTILSELSLTVARGEFVALLGANGAGKSTLLKALLGLLPSAAGTLSVLGRPPGAKPGFLFYVMVDSVAATLDAIVANGGEMVQPIGADAPEITARFRDPAGNVIGLYQQPA